MHSLYFSDLRSPCHRGTSLGEIFVEATLFTVVIFGRARFAIDGILWNLKRFHQRGRDHSMMKRILTKEPLRWFLLLWIAMAVVGALLGSNDSTFGSSHSGPPHTIISSGVVVVLNYTLPLSSTLIFLPLPALYSFLLLSGLSERVQPPFFWLYFLLQGLLVAVIQWMLQEPYLAFNLCLVLTRCSLFMSKRAPPP